MLLTMRNLIKRSRLSQGFYDVLILMSGTGISQGILILATPILTRIYEPEIFGLFAIYTTIVFIPASIITLRYEQAIMVASDENEVRQIIVLAFSLVIFMGLIFFLFFYFLGDVLLSILGILSLSSYVNMILWGIITLGILNILIQLCSRFRLYKLISSGRIKQTIILVLIQTIGGMANFGIASLIIAYIASQFLYICILIKNNYAMIFGYKISRNNIINVAAKYKDFPMFYTPNTLLDCASLQLPIIMLNTLYTSEIAGYYFLTNRVLSIPMGLIGGSVAQVFYQRLARCKENKEDARRLLVQTWIKLAAIGFIPMFLILIFGPELFALVFGDMWKKSGEFASILCIMMLFLFVGSPASSVLTVYRKQHISILFGICAFICRGVSLYIGFPDINKALIYYSLQECILVSIYFAVSYYFVKKEYMSIEDNKC